MATDRRLTAIVVTFRRPEQLAETLSSVLMQTRPPDGVLVVDNDPHETARSVVAQVDRCTYVAAGDNLGPAGAVALGMRSALSTARDDDIVVVIDDDDPMPHNDAIERLIEALDSASRTGLRCAGVGLTGARYRYTRGDFARVRDTELNGFVEVDYIGGGHCPCFRVAAIRDVGTFDSGFFFGFEEAEFGLRLRRAGWTLIVPGDYLRQIRAERGRLAMGSTLRSTTPLPAWRQYYSSRNAMHLARRYGSRRARTMTTVRGLLPTPANRAIRQRAPGSAMAAIRGTIAGMRGELGRTVDPT